MNEGDDVLHVNVGSGITTAHIASLANSADTTVYAVGIHSDLQRHQIVSNLERFGCRCIRFRAVYSRISIAITPCAIGRALLARIAADPNSPSHDRNVL